MNHFPLVWWYIFRFIFIWQLVCKLGIVEVNFLLISCLYSYFDTLPEFCQLFFISKMIFALKSLSYTYTKFFVLFYSINVVSALSYLASDEHGIWAAWIYIPGAGPVWHGNYWRVPFVSHAYAVTWCDHENSMDVNFYGPFTRSYRCRRGSSTQEQRYPPPLPLGATAPPTCGRRESGPGLRVITQDQEYPLRNVREIRYTYFISLLYLQLCLNNFCKSWPQNHWYNWISKYIEIW